MQHGEELAVGIASMTETRRWPWGLIWTALIIFLAALDQTVVITVLPNVVSTLGLDVEQALEQGIWVITGYLLGYTVAMPLLGRIADAYGHRRLFLAALGVFVGGSIGCALADSVWSLVAWRIVQAIGGGAVLPIGLAISMDEVKPIHHATALGIMGAAGEAGGVLGPAYGGLISQIQLLDIDGWRWVFWLNIPLGAALAWAIIRTLPDRPGNRGAIDYVGGGLIAVSLTALTVALSRSLGSLAIEPSAESGNLDQYAVQWTSPLTIGLLVLAVLSFIGFIWWERRTATPLIELSAFRTPAFSAANITNVLVGMALIVGMVNVPFFVGTVLAGDALSGGLTLMRLTMMIPIGAVLGGMLMRRMSARLVAGLGMITTAIGFALLGFWVAETNQLQLTIYLLLTGTGFGLVLPALSAAAIGTVARESMGTAAGLLNALRMVGITLGVSALASWSLAYRASLNSKLVFTMEDFNTGAAQLALTQNEMTVYHSTFFAAAVVGLLALIPIWWLPRERSEGDTPLFA